MQHNITCRQKNKGWQYIISYKDNNGIWKQRSKQGFEKKKDAKMTAEEHRKNLENKIEISVNLEPEYQGITLGKFAQDLLEHEKLYKTYNTIEAKEIAIERFKIHSVK